MSYSLSFSAHLNDNIARGCGAKIETDDINLCSIRASDWTIWELFLKISLVIFGNKNNDMPWRMIIIIILLHLLTFLYDNPVTIRKALYSIAHRNHLHRIPIVLVFGVSLSLSSLRSTLTHEISTMLSIEAFQMTSSSIYLSTIIQQVCIIDLYSSL